MTFIFYQYFIKRCDVGLSDGFGNIRVAESLRGRPFVSVIDSAIGFKFHGLPDANGRIGQIIEESIVFNANFLLVRRPARGSREAPINEWIAVENIFPMMGGQDYGSHPDELINIIKTAI